MPSLKKILSYGGGGIAAIALIVISVRLTSPTPVTREALQDYVTKNALKNYLTTDQCNDRFVNSEDWAEWKDNEPNRLQEYIEGQTGSTPEPVATQTLRPASNPLITSVLDATPTKVSSHVVNPVTTPPPTGARSASIPAPPSADTTPAMPETAPPSATTPRNLSSRPASFSESATNDELAYLRRLVNEDALRQVAEHQRRLEALDENEGPNGKPVFVTPEYLETSLEEMKTDLLERIRGLINGEGNTQSSSTSPSSTSTPSSTRPRGLYRGGAKRHH